MSAARHVAADNINGPRRGLSRPSQRRQEGLGQLKGDGGWTEIAGCPVFTNDRRLGQPADGRRVHQEPKLDAFILIGGWAQFGPQAYAQVTDQVLPRLKSKERITHRRGHVAASARCIEGRDAVMPRSAAAVRDGIPRADGADRPHQRQEAGRSVYTGLDECTRPTSASARRSDAGRLIRTEGGGRPKAPLAGRATLNEDPGAAWRSWNFRASRSTSARSAR